MNKIKIYLTNGEYISVLRNNIEAEFLPEAGIVDIRETFGETYVSLYTIPTEKLLYIDWGHDE